MISIALYEPEIPQNTGTIIRTCAAFGLNLYLIKPYGFIWDNKLLKRASMDYLSHVNIVHLNNLDELFALSSNVVLTCCENATPYTSFNYRSSPIILFGKESTGLPSKLLLSNLSKITIPMQESARSLNLAISVGIISSFALYQTTSMIQY